MTISQQNSTSTLADDAALRTDLATAAVGKGADLVSVLYGGTVTNALGFITPEMFGAVGDGVADDTAAINKAIDVAYRSNLEQGKKESTKYNIQRVYGKGLYHISRPIVVNNFRQGFELNLGGLIVNEKFPGYTDWKNATGAISVGSDGGGQVGLNIRVGYFNGANKATLFKLGRAGAGGSQFHADRAINAVGVFQCTDSDLANSASNRITGGYWQDGVFGIRIKRKGGHICEGTKISVGFMTNFKYGGIQLFDGAQYFQIYGTDVDFCGKYLTQLGINALPGSDIRGMQAVSGSVSCEVLDYYNQPAGKYYALVIEGQNTTGGNSAYTVGNKVVINGVTYTISSITTTTVKQAHFDFIHGFEGASFAKGEAQFGYCSRIVGGMQHTSFFKWHNSFDINSNMLNGLFVHNNGSEITFTDKYRNVNLLRFNTTNQALQLPGSLTNNGHRMYGAQLAPTLVSGSKTPIKTFSYEKNGVNSDVKEVWEVVCSGPNGLNGVGGTFTVHVSSVGIELVGSLPKFPTFTVSDFTLNAQQNAQPTMKLGLIFNRK